MEDQPTLVLHFDINKTLVISDPASGQDFEGMLNSIISEAAWGKENDQQEWEACEDQLYTLRPNASLINYHDWVEKVKFEELLLGHVFAFPPLSSTLPPSSLPSLLSFSILLYHQLQPIPCFYSSLL